MANIQLDDNAMSQLVQKAIFDSMTTEQREALLAGAIKQITTRPEKRNYGHNPRSEIEEIFQRQASRVAEEILRKDLEQPAEWTGVDGSKPANFRAMVETLVRKAVTQLCDSARNDDGKSATDVIVEVFSDAFVKALRGW